MIEGKRLLVTGLTGNLGGAFAEELAKHNEVWGLARFSKEGELQRWRDAGVNCVVGDYAYGQFEGLPSDFDYVIHSAANTRPKSFAEGMRDNAWGVGKLMNHCKDAKAFLHLSTSSVLELHPDPHHRYTEQDVTGSGKMGHYGGTKLAGEGAVMAMSVHLGLPVSICRMNVQYGTHKDGGLYGIILAQLLRGEVVQLPHGETQTCSPMANEDIVLWLQGCLDAATVPGTVINWGGDEPVNTIDVINHMAEVAGIEPRYELSTSVRYATIVLDPNFRQSLVGRAKTDWRTGIERMVRHFMADPQWAYKAAGQPSAGVGD